MRAILFPSPEQITLATLPDPVPGRDEVVIKVARAGLCGTDIHIHRNEYLSPFPLTPGHEFCGVIVETGVDVTHLKVGQRVAVDPNIDCGHCDFCRRQQNNQCRNWQGIGITRPGAFAEYVAAPARLAYVLPDAIDDTQAAFIEPLSCVVHAINRLAVDVGDTALLFGAGPIGLLLMQVLLNRGVSRIVVVDKQPSRLQLAGQLGATETVVAGLEQEARLRSLAPDGFHIVADATGVPAVITGAFDHLRPYGRYLQFGVTPRDATVPIQPFRLFKNDWTIMGSFALCYTFQPAIALLASRAVDVTSLVSDVLPLESFESGFRAFERGEGLKVQFVSDR